MIINRGFRQKRPADPTRLPPGQYETRDYPVLSLGPTPRVSREQWRLKVGGLAEATEWDWKGFQALPMADWTVDIHCVTKWSKSDTVWRGVFLDDIIGLVRPSPLATHLLAFSDDGYSTNIPLGEVIKGQAMVAVEYVGGDIPAQHGGPVRMLVPHLYFWKSAKWLNELRFVDHDVPGFWETRGYHNHGDPWKEERYSE